MIIECIHYIFLPYKTKRLFKRCLSIVENHIGNANEINELINSKNRSSLTLIFSEIGDRLESENIDVADLWIELKTVSIWHKDRDLIIHYDSKLTS